MEYFTRDNNSKRSDSLMEYQVHPSFKFKPLLSHGQQVIYKTLDFFSTITCYFFLQQNFKKNMPKRKPLSLQTVELKVRMCCTGCERVVRNAIHRLRGVDSVEVDIPMEKVTVIGYLDRNKVIKTVRRSGKRAEFWPNPQQPLYFTSEGNYFKDENDYRQSYNYWRHGYNGDRHGRIPVTYRGDDRVSNIFNDDNVHACSIM